MRRVTASTTRRGVYLVGIVILLFGAGKAIGWAQRAAPEGAIIINHLDSAIGWYKQLVSANEAAGQASDTYYFENARNLAKQALQLAFQSAEAEAELVAAGDVGEAGDANSGSQGTPDQKNLNAAAANATGQLNQVQAQLEALDKEIPRASGKRREQLHLQHDSLQAELELDKAVQEAIQKLVNFEQSSTGRKAGLEAEIKELKKSVPALSSNAPAKGATPAASPAGLQPAPSPGGGLISQASLLITKLSDQSEIDQLMDGTGKVSDLARQLQTPLRAKLKTAIQLGRDLANQPPSPDPTQAEAIRKNITTLTAQFKQISSATLPLTQEIILLGETRANLGEWRDSIHKECLRILKLVVTRLVAIFIGIGILVVISRFWRRATIRYIREPRRRHQLLLVQRFVTGFCMVVVIILGFVSEFGSLATFAGFLTAGIAVALQTVILSVAAYFFLIGRYGVRVGDRITVSGVTGDVVDVGIVRLYLMELAGTGVDLHPTGRLVVVSNSALFQGAPFFKQIPGTAYTWHEVAVPLSRGSDHKLAETKFLEAVNSVYSQYREIIERQYESSEGLTQGPFSSPSPQGHLQLLDNGLELIIRYPVEIQREAEIDSQMARKLIEVIDSTPDLKNTAGSPRIRAAIKA